MRVKVLVILLGAICLISSVAMADLLNGSGSWSNNSSISLNENGTPFWDNPSMDGANLNVGFQLQSYYGSSWWSSGQFWSIHDQTHNYTVDNNVTFTSQGGAKTLALLITIAGNVSSNKLYLYDASGSNTAGSKILVFDGLSAPPTTTVTVSLPATWTAYGLEIVGPGGTFFSSQGHGETSSDSKSNFAFFQQPNLSNTWWVGVEDLQDATGNGATGKECLGDYNDLILEISAIPLPPTLLLFGSGLIGLLGLGRRFRKS